MCTCILLQLCLLQGMCFGLEIGETICPPYWLWQCPHQDALIKNDLFFGLWTVTFVDLCCLQPLLEIKATLSATPFPRALLRATV
mmetsp:Transcript_11426/g.27633  ORF Transcript_11426/g.27633 Transcript_11426/m.27633 type:complete len:85 (+) Transcript_11426:374-628(+)